MKRKYFDVHWNDYKNSPLVRWIESYGISVVPYSSLFEYNSFYNVIYIQINGQFLRVLDNDCVSKYVFFDGKNENDRCFENIENEFFENYRGKRIRIIDIINHSEKTLIVPDEIELEILRLSLGEK